LLTNDGVDIELHFKPGDEVDASLIGIIQKVTSISGGAPLALNPTVAARSIPAGSPHAGAHIDRLDRFNNPIYGTNAVGVGAPADKLWDAPPIAHRSQQGYHHVDSKGVLAHHDAVIEDTPQLGGAGPNSSQIFEDTALAVTGVQTGATYGSVQWGWRINGAGAFSRLPLTKVADDVPSGNFRQAQTLWNRNHDAAGNNLIPFFTRPRQFVQTDNTPMVSNPGDAIGTELLKLAQNARVEVIDKGVSERFNTADPRVKWWKIVVTEGASIGTSGWVRSSELGGAPVRAAGAP
jgi:hypothetical protein